jgi:hypothetical protein
LAPLPDEPELVDADDDMEQEEAATAPAAPPGLTVPEPEAPEDDNSKAPSPQPQLTMPTEDSAQDSGELAGGLQLEDSLKPVDVNMDDLEGPVDDNDNNDGLGDKDGGPQLELDMTGMGPDGLQLEGAHDLAQVDADDAIAGPTEMDESEDPFAPAP